MEPRIRVLVVDDHLAFAEALGLALALEKDFEVVPVASDAASALDAVRRCRPDVVVMDVQFPNSDGVDMTRQVLAIHPSARVIILSGFLDVETLTNAAEAGASAFLLKDEPVQRVIDLIRPNDDPVITMRTLKGVLDRMSQRNPGATDGVTPPLTAREAEVLTLLSKGVDAQAIARRLGITVNTSRSHVKNLMAKLGAHSQLEAVALATQSGLISR